MKYPITLVAIVVLSMPMFGQVEAILNARCMKNTLYLVPGKITTDDGAKRVDQFKLYGNANDVDRMLWEHSTYEEDTLILVKDGTLNIRLLNPNPLGYRLKVDGAVYEDDPYDATMKTLLSNINTLLGTITGVAFTPVPEAQLFQASTLAQPLQILGLKNAANFALADTTASGERAFSLAFVKDPELKFILDLLVLSNKASCISSLDTDSTEVAHVQQELDFDHALVANGVIQILNAIDLSEPSCKDALDALGNSIAEMDKKNEKLSTAVKALGPDATAPATRAAECKIPVAMWNEGMGKFKAKALKELEARTNLTKKLRELLSTMLSYRTRTTAFESRSLEVYSSALRKGKIEKVRVSLKPRKFGLNTDMKITVDSSGAEINKQFKFMKTHTFYPNVAPALVLFERMQFAEFTAEEDAEGDFIVTRTESAEDWQALAGMVNFNFKLGRNAEVPFMQLGATVRHSNPMLFMGAGIRFGKYFGLAAGTAFRWQQELKTLSVGQEVDRDSAVKDDLAYRMLPAQFYLAFNVNIPGTLAETPKTGLKE